MDKKKTIRSAEDKKVLKNRVHRIVGQLSGIDKMIDDDRYCYDILVQLSAVSSAAKSVATLLIEKHIQSCVADQLGEGKQQVIEELIDIFKRF